MISGDITIETEMGRVIDSLDVSIGEFVGAIFLYMPQVLLLQTHCLQFIDPYGDTTFNMLQKKILVSELELLVSKTDSNEANSYFQPIIEFISKYEDRVHIYVKFHGD